MESINLSNSPEDKPLNELESQLFACIKGSITREEFIQEFVNSSLYILVDGEPVGDTLGDRRPLVVAADQAQPRLLAVFSAAERAKKMTAVFTEFDHPILVTAQWAFDVIGPQMGIAFNPGCHFGFEIAPEGAQQLKAAIALTRAEHHEK